MNTRNSTDKSKEDAESTKASSLATSATILKGKQKETTPKDYLKQSRHLKETTIKKWAASNPKTAQC